MCNQTKGFTLIEIIAVLVILAILSAVAYSRIISTGPVNNQVAAETLKNHIRYVQLKAMNSDADAASGCKSSHGLKILANSYYMFKDCDDTIKVVLPGANSNEVSLGGSLSLSPANTNITFDRYGRPCSDLYGSTLYAANKVITLGTETITITKNTGFVP